MSVQEPEPKSQDGNCFKQHCVARMVLSHLSNRWASLIIAALKTETVLRFSELRARVEGISEKVLSEKLRELERDGLVSRKMYPVVPPRVDYRLTEIGAGAAQHIEGFVHWIEANIRGFELAQQLYDTKAGPSGKE